MGRMRPATASTSRAWREVNACKVSPRNARAPVDFDFIKFVGRVSARISSRDKTECKAIVKAVRVRKATPQPSSGHGPATRQKVGVRHSMPATMSAMHANLERCVSKGPSLLALVSRRWLEKSFIGAQFIVYSSHMGGLLTTEAAAKYLGVTPSRVRQFIMEDRLKSVKYGRDHLIQESELKQFAQHGKKKRGRPEKQRKTPLRKR